MTCCDLLFKVIKQCSFLTTGAYKILRKKDKIHDQHYHYTALFDNASLIQKDSTCYLKSQKDLFTEQYSNIGRI